MYQTLFYIPSELFGLPVFGVGLLLGLWLLMSGAYLASLWLRGKPRSEIAGYLPVLFLVAAAIVFVLPRLSAVESGVERGIAIRSYGVMMLLGVVCGVTAAAYRAKRIGADPEIVFSLAFWCFVFGILGARAFHVIQYWENFTALPANERLWAVFNVAQGGLVFYGAIIGGVAAGVVFSIRRSVPVLAMADLIAPSVMIGLAFGRIGCFLNGCCFGGPCDMPWKATFPDGSPPYIAQLHAGQLQGIEIEANDRDQPIIASIDPDGPASNLGLVPGDRIVAVNGGQVDSVDRADSYIRTTGRTIWLKTLDGTELGWSLPPHNAHLPEDEFYGLVFADDEAGRPTIAKVWSGGGPAKVGFRAGQQVVNVNGAPVASAAEAEKALKSTGTTLFVIRADGRGFGWPMPPRSGPIHPTQVYSSIAAAFLVVLLSFWYQRRRRDGEVTAISLTLYPINRFVLEIVRTDEGGQFGTRLTIAQWISLAIFAGAIGLWLHLRRSAAGELWPTGSGSEKS